MIEKQPDCMKANETIRKEFDKLSRLVTPEQVILLLVNVYGAENVNEFLLEEVENIRKNEQGLS